VLPWVEHEAVARREIFGVAIRDVGIFDVDEEQGDVQRSESEKADQQGTAGIHADAMYHKGCAHGDGQVS
jgi:hypothetical protein